MFKYKIILKLVKTLMLIKKNHFYYIKLKQKKNFLTIINNEILKYENCIL